MEDQLIIDLFNRRSEDGITEISQKYGKLCITLAQNILKNEQDAEECVNDAYMAAWNTIPPAKPDSLSAYICRITRNLPIKKYHYNIAKKRNSHYDVILDEFEECIGSGEFVEDEIMIKEMTEEINIFLGKLKEKDRIIFMRRYWFCDSISEIAENMGVSTNYVMVHLHRTREKLKKYFKVEDDYERKPFRKVINES